MNNAITVFTNCHMLGSANRVDSFAVSNGKFVALPAYDNAQICTVDLQGYTVAPALLDTHTHGVMGVDFTQSTGEQIQSILPYYNAHGVTSILATVMTQDIAIMCRQLDICAQLVSPTSTIKGIHLEGPFLSAQYKGAMEQRYLQPIDLNTFDKLFMASRGTIKQITIAPELDNAIQLTKYAVSLGVTVSLGHTAATPTQANKCIEQGAKCVAHLYNAMDKSADKGGLLDYYLHNDELYCEMISDGQHIPPPMLNSFTKIKSQSKTVLISDSIMATGVPYGIYTLAGQTVTVSEKGVFLANGKRAGSNANNFDNMLLYSQYADIPLQEAIKCATINPSTMLAIDNIGRIGQDCNADFVLLDDNNQLCATYHNGICVFRE